VFNIKFLSRLTQNQTLTKRITLPLVISLAVLLGIATILIVQTMRKITHDRVISESLGLVQNGACQIEQFYSERARIPMTIFQSPLILNWFERYYYFRQPVAGDRTYDRIIRYFNTIIQNDSTINSVFFATERTQEYFDEEGRYEEDGYYVKDRPWWKKTIEKNRLYTDLGDVDYQDSTRTATLQMPVLDSQEQLLGIGGIDISVDIVHKVVRDVQYHDEGVAFLINELGQLIYFPDFDTEESWLTELCSLDELFQNTRGMCDLSERMLEGTSGYTKVKWLGKDQMVLFAPVKVMQADIHWSLGFFIPEKTLYAPVRRMTALSVIISLLIFGAIIGISTYMTRRTIRPLDLLATHLDGLVQERLDLTQEMSLESMEAVRTTAQNFNMLLGQMREFLKRVIRNAEQVGISSTNLRDESAEMSSRTSVMSDRAKESTSHAKQLLHTVKTLSTGIQEVAHMCSQSNQSVMEGESVLISQLDQIKASIEKMSGVYEFLKALNEKSKNLKEAVGIIDDISERISLLAINASIEAVKAGEIGKGFSVVAEEIQQMSQDTAEANRRTADLLSEFETEFGQFLNDMDQIKSMLSDEMASFDSLVKRFRQIQDGVALTDRSAGRMREEAQRQINCIQDLNENIDTIHEAATNLADHISNSIDKINAVDEKVKELKESTNLFKVE